MNEYIVVDFDGTINFNNNEKDILDIIGFIRKKYSVIIATGRNYYNFTEHFPNITNSVDMIIFSNGASWKNKSVYKYKAFNKSIIKRIIREKIFKGEIIVELENGEKLTADNLNLDDTSKVISLQIINNNDKEYYWNINIANSYNLEIIIDNNNYIRVFDKNINKLFQTKKLLKNKGVLKKAIGNDFNDCCFYTDENIKVLHITENIIPDFYNILKKFLDE